MRCDRLGMIVAAAMLIAGCGGPGSDPGMSGELVVSAASSLADVFSEIEVAFETANPGVDVVLNFASSTTLRSQIIEGAPVDVYASADVANVDEVVAAGRAATTPSIFARNRPQIAVPSGNPAGIIGITDFSIEALLLGVCAEGVPCGDLARQALAAAGVVPSIDTDEPNVRALLTKIETGELDAGIVYASDVIAWAGSVEGIDLPAAVDVTADYAIVVIAATTQPSAADAFVAFVLSVEGRAILAEYGFESP